ncbi:MAG: MFS transporter [Actinomycetota bacterium]
MSGLPPVGRDGWRTVGISSAAVFMVSMEITVISLAFPEIREQFSDTSESALSWVFSAYNIGVASLLLIGGWSSERYGHKRVFLTGVSIFLAGSILAGVAASAEMLIAARVVQAAGGALQSPAGLALILAAAPPARHQMVIGIWGAAGALAAAAGPTIGALLVEGFGWRAVFLINIPIIGAALVLGRRWLPDTEPSPGTESVDLVSVPLAGVGVGALVLGIVQVETWGWSSGGVIGSFVLGLVLVAAFLVRSARHPAPLFDLGLYRLRSFSVANVATVFFAFAFFGWLVPLPTLIQTVWGWSVLETGFAIAPGPLLAFFVAPPAGRIADRVGNRWILTVCGVSGMIGMLLLRANFGTEPQYLSDVLLPSVFIGVAAGTGFSQLVGAAMRDVPAHQYAMGGAGRTTVFQMAIALGIAVAVAVIGRPAEPTEALAVYDDSWLIGAIAYAVMAAIAAAFYPNKPATVR